MVLDTSSCSSARNDRRNGDEYRGTFLDGRIEGTGVMTFSSHPSFSRYEGGWKNGAFEGSGVLKLVDGETYEGSWQGGKRNGQGVHTYPPQIASIYLSYEGEWKNDEYHGIGGLKL